MRGSIMTAMAALERVRRHAASTSFSAMYWSVASMVSAMPCPGTEALRTIGAPVTSRPRASRSTRARPSAPARCASHTCSTPPRPLPSSPSKPIDVGGQLTARVEPQALLEEAQARRVELPHRLRHGGRQLALDPDEPLGGIEAPRDVGGWLAQDGRQRARERLGVVDAMGQREERIGAGGFRQHLPAAVDDGPALGPEGDGLGVLAFGQPGVLVVLDDLQIGQPAEDPEEGAGDQRREDERPTPQARGAGGRHRGGAASPRFMLADRLGDRLSGRGGALRRPRTPRTVAGDELARQLDLLLGGSDHAEPRAGFDFDPRQGQEARLLDEEPAIRPLRRPARAARRTSSR